MLINSKAKVSLTCSASSMSEKEIMSIRDRLTKIINLIDDLSPQCQPYPRSEGNKIEYLPKNVFGNEWSKNAVRNIVYFNYSFNGFGTVINEDLQLKTEFNLANAVITIGIIAKEIIYWRYDRNR